MLQPHSLAFPIDLFLPFFCCVSSQARNSPYHPLAPSLSPSSVAPIRQSVCFSCSPTNSLLFGWFVTRPCNDQSFGGLPYSFLF